MKNRSFTIVVLLLSFCCEAFASSAYPFPIKVKTEKDSATIILQGDEHCKYAYTEDGYTVVARGEKWFFAQMDDNNKLKATSYELEGKNYRSRELDLFLKRQAKYLTPSRNAAMRASYQKESIHRAKVEGRRKILIVLMSFADYAFTKNNSDFDALFNQPGYDVDGASGSVYDYYKYVSYDQLELECTVIGPFTAAHEMAYYGGNKGMSESDKNPYELFREALTFARGAVDLKEYDGNNDGYIDNFHIIYAGYGEEAGASSDAIWAHEMTFEPTTVEGLMIDRYSCAPELRGNRGSGISRIGPHCHEIGHALGAMDYYDTNYATGGNYPGTGKWDVMASGSWNNDGINPANFNPYVKAYNFGWSEVEEVTGEGSVDIAPSSDNATILRLNTSVEGDYFLLENRQQKSFDASVPGHGLLLFHIGPQIEAKSKKNIINATAPQECYVVCASAPAMYPTAAADSYGNINSAGCPFPGSENNTQFADDTTPAAFTQSGEVAGFVLYEIQETSDGTITLKYNANGSSTPVDPLPQEGETVWEETFGSMMISDFWSQQSIVNNSVWKIKKKVSSGSVESFAELVSDTSGFDPEGYYGKTHLISSLFDVEESDYVLSFQCAHSTQGKDSLNILVMNNEAGVLETISKNKVAAEFFVNKKVLIKSAYVPFRIAIEGIVAKRSTIMLDNIVLRKAESTTGILSDLRHQGKEDAIYSISGSKRKALLPGLNIIRNNDMTYKKVMRK